ncbi:hypothetical protein ERVG_00308 [Emiliania huxleyi virus 208]|nr:hypothetical protein ERVG_00308 [Emiliania huxleyi virus 208]
MATASPRLWAVTVERDAYYFQETDTSRHMFVVLTASSEEDARARFLAKHAPIGHYVINAFPYKLGDWIEIDTGDHTKPF